MRVDITDFAGVILHPSQVHHDERGSFVKLTDTLTTATQVCTSHTSQSGTVRGLHVQLEPHPETKHLWCARGRVLDVLVDTRPDQPTYGDWACVELDGQQSRLLTVPPGVAHGYQSLTDDVLMSYLIYGEYAPESARTLRWDDPSVGIEWPMSLTCISESDRAGQPWPLSS